MRTYNNLNVYEAAVQRLNWLFDEFPNVVVSVSGGKDSTVIFHMTLKIAQERNRLPLNVLFIDQEGEWASTVEEIRYMMYHPDVKPFWLQIPLKLFNATSHDDHWLTSWDPACPEDWIHPQDPISLKENIYKNNRFHKAFDAALRVHFGATPTANIGGVRTEESPRRLMGLTHMPTYKWATWGKVIDRKLNHYTFYPLYDWSYSDVWKSIWDHKWPYNRVYDSMYQYGVPHLKMRVSNFFHEVSIPHLFYIEEFEPETYARLAKRLKGIDMAAKLGATDFWVYELPFVFSTWRAYRDYLLEHLIDNPEWRRLMAARFAQHDRELGEGLGDVKYKAQVNSILAHDWEGAKIANFRNRASTMVGSGLWKADPVTFIHH